MNPDQEYVLKTIESRDVHFVRFWFTDLLGRVKSFAVSPNEIETAFSEGMGFDGSRIAGFTLDPEDSCDLLAFPDASTFQVLPWRPNADAVARMFCSIRTSDGTPLEKSPRRILARTIELVGQAGYTVSVAPEVEYFYFKDSAGTELLDRGGYFDLNTLDSASDLRRDTVLTLEKMGIPIEYSHHEVAPSQNEVDLRPSDAMSMADAVQTYKMVVKEIAAAHGVFASFMPKPRTDCPGSGMHVHQSFFNTDGANVFFDENDPWGLNLSDIAKSYIAGLIKYMPELSLLTNQFVNSYKRLVVGGEAPTHATWGRSGRGVMVRIPAFKPDKESELRVVLRNPDPACNPYLAFAAMLRAGLAGIEEGLVLAAPNTQDDSAAQALPRTLGEAIDWFAASPLARDILGDEVHTFLVQEKKREWDAYLAHVSDWEIDRFLEVL